MKKFLLALGVIALLGGCAISETNKETKTAAKMAQESQTILFTAVKNPAYKVSVTSSDYFDTAVFIDANGKKHNLKNDISANGIRLTNSEGIDLAFHRGMGYLTPGKNQKEIELKYTE
ncbi:hypothetical protein U5B43_09475 [Campylobacter sp. 9BO]|uniref:hypothetical protein n=1 Tax=Campylobacter sp. 9BO TaxID=3424759 RepID=UPI003D355889